MKANGTTSSQFRKKQIVALGVSGGTTTHQYIWSVDQNGFGTKYANPVSDPNVQVNSLIFDPNYNKIVVMNTNTAEAPRTWNWSLDSGYGTLKTTIGSWPGGAGSWGSFNKSFSSFFVVSSATPFINAWPYDSTTLSYGTKFSNPSTIPSDGYSLISNKTEDIVFYALRVSPYLDAYQWSNSSGWGTKYTSPTSIGATTSYMAMPNDNSTWVLGGGAASTYAYAVAFNKVSGWGTTYTASTAATEGSPIAGSGGFSPSEQYMAKGKPTTNSGGTVESSILAWPFNTNAVSTNPFGTRFAAPGSLTGPNATTTRRQKPFSSTGHMIVSNSSTSPFIAMWPWTSSGFGSRYANPSTVPATATASNYSEIN